MATDQATDQAVTVTLEGHNLWSVAVDGDFAAALSWTGDLMRMVDEDGFHLATLYRSDGKIISGAIVYTYRAYLALNDAEVARGASLEDACKAVLDWEPVS